MLKRQLFKQQPSWLDTRQTNHNNVEKVEGKRFGVNRSRAVRNLCLTAIKICWEDTRVKEKRFWSLGKEKIKSKRLFVEVPEEEGTCQRDRDYFSKKKIFTLKIKNPETKPQINSSSRVILVDWLYQVAEQFHISKLALHRAIYYLDKLTYKKNIEKKEYQYYGLTCLFISHKIDTRKCLSYGVASNLVEETLSQEQFEEYQRKILKKLAFKLTPLTLWEEMSMILLGFELFIGNQVTEDQSWIKLKKRALWVVEGITLQKRYVNRGSQSQAICLELLSNFSKDVSLVQNQKVVEFCLSITSQKVNIKSLGKVPSFWLIPNCFCDDLYSQQIYHPELKKIIFKN